MGLAKSRFMRQVAGCLVLLVMVQAAEATAQSSQESAIAQPARSTTPDNSQAGDPGTASQNGTMNDTVQAASDRSVGSGQQGQNTAASGSSSAEPDSAQQQSSPAKPVGTAAAPALSSTGVAGSRPTGAVIAPAKQRRVRTILIRLGVVIGACVAVGTVAALSHSSPSQPRQ